MSLGDVAGDLAARLKKKQEKAGNAPPQEDKPVDYKELYALRARMLGVLMRDARMAKGHSLEECAAWIGVSPQNMLEWEDGTATPSLPQLEILAYHLNVPVSRFWGDETLTGNNGRWGTVPQQEYIELRQRIIGTMLSEARAKANLTPEALAEQVGIPADQITRYELGETPVPMIELTSIASALDLATSYFLESGSRIGQMLALEESFQRFNEMPEAMRAFVSNPVNVVYIELAMWLSQMDVNDMRGLAESILHLSRLDPDELSHIAERLLDITL